MEEKLVDMIEGCGLEVEDIQHVVEYVEAQALAKKVTDKKIVGRIFELLLKEFDLQINSEKGARDKLKATPPAKSYHYHQGRVDGVDTGRFLVEVVMTQLEASDEPIELPELWVNQVSQDLELWEKEKGLTAELKEKYISTALTAVAEAMGSAAAYFNVDIDISDWRKGDLECVLNVNLTHECDWLEAGNIWICLYIDESDCVYMMVGEDGDVEMELNSSNFWSSAYLSAFCKPQ